MLWGGGKRYTFFSVYVRQQYHFDFIFLFVNLLTGTVLPLPPRKKKLSNYFLVCCERRGGGRGEGYGEREKKQREFPRIKGSKINKKKQKASLS